MEEGRAWSAAAAGCTRHESSYHAEVSRLLSALGIAAESEHDVGGYSVDLAVVAAQLLGAADAVFERTLAYLKERRQFDRCIGEFQALLKGELDPDKTPHSLGKLKIFSGIWHFPARVKCAALAWHTMNGALSQIDTVTTE